MDELATCSVCLEDFDVSNLSDKSQLPHRIPCSHIFHKDCIEGWFLKQKDCPVCRTTHKFTSVDEVVKYDPIVASLLVQIYSISQKKPDTPKPATAPTPTPTPVPTPTPIGIAVATATVTTTTTTPNKSTVISHDYAGNFYEIPTYTQNTSPIKTTTPPNTYYPPYSYNNQNTHYDAPKNKAAYQSYDNVDLSGLLKNSSISPKTQTQQQQPPINYYNYVNEPPKNKAAHQNYDHVDLSGLLKNPSTYNNSSSSNNNYYPNQNQHVSGLLKNPNSPSQYQQQQPYQPPLNQVSKLNDSIKRVLPQGGYTYSTNNGFNATVISSVSDLNQHHKPQQIKQPHVHPLKKTIPSPYSDWICDYCGRKGKGYSEQFRCTVCKDFDMCRYCILESKSVAIPTIQPLESIMLHQLGHPHPLNTMLPLDIYGNSGRCDKCMATISNSYIYHCCICTDFDVCSKCYNKAAQ